MKNIIISTLVMGSMLFSGVPTVNLKKIDKQYKVQDLSQQMQVSVPVSIENTSNVCALRLVAVQGDTLAVPGMTVVLTHPSEGTKDTLITDEMGYVFFHGFPVYGPEEVYQVEVLYGKILVKQVEVIMHSGTTKAILQLK